MKRVIILLILSVAFATFTSTSTLPVEMLEENMEYDLERFKVKVETEKFHKLNSLGLENFLNHLAYKESSNNPNVVNTLGYIGKYQFGRAALKEVGYGSLRVSEFRKNPSIFPEEAQDKAIIMLLKINRKRLESTIEKYEGKYIAGIKITEAGLLAAAHLAGASGVKRFLRTNGRYNPADSYGTRLSDYLLEFSKHEFILLNP
jgi:hypothetical protein